MLKDVFTMVNSIIWAKVFSSQMLSI